ncbi:MAG: T9SS type A sorting domain-containing protein, partial [Bacteroidales bacterium]|nr:T9SS type A sorting domain-containing protein [Bacteroidales bacterium]
EEINHNDLNCSIFPNPAQNSINISFTLDNSAKTTLSVYDMLGRVVKSIDFGTLSMGFNAKEIDVKDLKPSGYIYVLQANDHSVTGKFIIYK